MLKMHLIHDGKIRKKSVANRTSKVKIPSKYEYKIREFFDDRSKAMVQSYGRRIWNKLVSVYDKGITTAVIKNSEFWEEKSDHNKISILKDGSLPLHFAASLGNVPLAHLIYSKFPAAATTPNHKGKIPLHYAAREGRLDMVRLFLQHDPLTALMASPKNKTALHFAAAEGHGEIVRLLLQIFPQGATFPSKKGKLPLHFAARWGHLSIAHDLVRVFPQAVSIPDVEGCLPLHDAARQGQYLMARYLIERYPAALAVQNLRGEIPLFPCVRSHHFDLVLLLIQSWNGGGKHVLSKASSEDGVSQWPWEICELLLRGAVHRWHGCSLFQGREPPTVCLDDDAVETASGLTHIYSHCTSKCPPKRRSKSPIFGRQQQSKKQACHKKEHHANKKRPRTSSTLSASTSSPTELPIPTFIPLHAALESGASISVISRVIAEQADGCDLEKQDHLSRYALHWAVETCYAQDEENVHLILTQIIARSPSAAFSQRDYTNHLPLHIAIKKRASFCILAALLKKFPEAAIHPCHTQDEFQQVMPVFLACHWQCCIDTVYQLLRINPGVLTAV